MAALLAALPAQSLSAGKHGQIRARLGRVSAPVSSRAIASGLRRETGFPASQLTTEPVCGQPRPGRLTCFAQAVVQRRNGHRVGPLHVTRSAPMRTQPTSGAVRSAVANAAPGPPGTTAPAPYTAAYLQWAYDLTWLSANRGAGDTVAIVDPYDAPNAFTDMNTFRTMNGLPTLPECTSSTQTTCFEKVNQDGGSSPPTTKDETGFWNVEESLDIDAVSALCPLCKILVVEANSDDDTGNPDLEIATQEAAALGADQISLSFGGASTPDATDNDDWSYMGVSTLAAAGDEGYYYEPKYSGDVTYPAAESDVTAVGGTALSRAANARGFGESAWSITSCSTADTGECGTGSGCDTSQSVPSFQAGLTTDCAGRGYNDISADADPDSGLNIVDSNAGSEGCGTANNVCLVGGTSLATPLTAAYEALVGITPASSPAWAYSDRALLNDIVSGSDGTCVSTATLICNAAAGWDGPTGNGSINGDVATGGPGLGGAYVSIANADDTTVTGGVYPNGADTSYSVEYGTSASPSYSSSTTAVDAGTGPGLQSISTLLCGLTPNTLYHYRLVASNASGTEYGYDNTFTTSASESAPTNITAPTISGTAAVGQTLTAQPGTWDDCNPNPSYQWQEASSASGPFTAIQGATSSTYTPVASDANDYLRVAVTESNSAGTGTAADSQATGPVASSPTTTTTTPTTTTTAPPVLMPPPTITSTVTSTTTTPTSTTSPGAGETVKFYVCARACVLLNTRGATSYRTTKADYGKYIKVVTTVSSGTSAPPTVRVRWAGPLTAPTAGFATIGTGARVASVQTVKGSTHTALAQVRVVKRTVRRSTTTLSLSVSRQGKISTSVWAYVVKKGAVVSCTATHSVNRPAKLSLALTKGETVKLVAVRA